MKSKAVPAFFRLIRWPNLLFISLTQSLFYFSIIIPSFYQGHPEHENILGAFPSAALRPLWQIQASDRNLLLRGVTLQQKKGEEPIFFGGQILVRLPTTDFANDSSHIPRRNLPLPIDAPGCH